MNQHRTVLLACTLALACGQPPATTGASASSDGSQGSTSTGGSTGPAPTTGSTTEAPTTGSTGAQTGAPFVGEPDAGAPPCDPWLQDCPEGQKCAPTASGGDGPWDSLTCVPVMDGAAAVGEPCTAEGGVDSCQKGALCWDVDPDLGQGTCIQQCAGSPADPSCPDDTSCVHANAGVLTLCLPGCDPLAQDCKNLDVCLPNPDDDDAFVCVADASGEAGQQWDACQVDNACDPGLVCASPTLAAECDPQAQGCCLPFCDLTMPACAGAGQQCLPWYAPGQAPSGLEDVGLCGIPG